MWHRPEGMGGVSAVGGQPGPHQAGQLIELPRPGRHLFPGVRCLSWTVEQVGAYSAHPVVIDTPALFGGVGLTRSRYPHRPGNRAWVSGCGQSASRT